MLVPTPKVFLHIGRNKVGSTTLQANLARQAGYLRRAGFDHVLLFGQPGPADGSLQSFANHRDVAMYARGRTGRSVLVSHEGLSCFSAELTRVMAEEFVDLDTHILFYVRPYGEWVVSSYNFDVRTGFNAKDFDEYLAGAEAGVSFWPMLEVWGRTLGWDRIRVRSLHPADLQGGDLVTDCLSALGLGGALAPDAGRANVSPSWWVVELLRLVARGGSGAGWQAASLAVAEELHRLTDRAAEHLGLLCPPGRYLSRAQASRLGALYERDLGLLAAHTGTQLQPGRAACVDERAFLPSAEHVPERVIRLVCELALDAENARLHPEAAAFVGSGALGAG